MSLAFSASAAEEQMWPSMEIKLTLRSPTSCPDADSRHPQTYRCWLRTLGINAQEQDVCCSNSLPSKRTRKESKSISTRPKASCGFEDLRCRSVADEKLSCSTEGLPVYPRFGYETIGEPLVASDGSFEVQSMVRRVGVRQCLNC